MITIILSTSNTGKTSKTNAKQSSQLHLLDAQTETINFKPIVEHSGTSGRNSAENDNCCNIFHQKLRFNQQIIGLCHLNIPKLSLSLSITMTYTSTVENKTYF